MGSARPSIVWLRHDLRLADNPALAAALERERPVVCVFIWAPDEEGDWPPGAASRWWLHHSLTSLDEQLRERGNLLVVRRGPTTAALQSVIEQTGADAVYWNRRYEPAIVRRDADVLRTLKQDGVRVEQFNSALLFEPWDVQTGQGKPYQVFTPFWKSCLAKDPPDHPLPAPDRIPGVESSPESVQVEELGLLPKFPWDGGLYDAWQPGEPAAIEQLDRFAAECVQKYADVRNIPGEPGTSRLSPRLHFGEIGPRQVWHAVRQSGSRHNSTDVFLSEIGWREFAHHVLHHFPHTTHAPLRDRFASFPWKADAAGLKAWQQGRTGYPIVDAGMRELWETGWMHNRVRMIVGSFLTKDLLISWQAGARWFWDTLVDADLASNTLGWQWVSGCGADAAPYFRVFNPMTQGRKFDGDGAYVRRWVGEIADLPDTTVHEPWAAKPDALKRAGIDLGSTYPEPIVDHAEARKRALEAYSQ